MATDHDLWEERDLFPNTKSSNLMKSKHQLKELYRDERYENYSRGVGVGEDQYSRVNINSQQSVLNYLLNCSPVKYTSRYINLEGNNRFETLKNEALRNTQIVCRYVICICSFRISIIPLIESRILSKIIIKILKNKLIRLIIIIQIEIMI